MRVGEEPTIAGVDPGVRSLRSRAMRPVLGLVLGSLAVVTIPASAGAQALRVELNGGAAIGNYTSSEAGLDVLPRPAYGVLVELWPTATLAGYAGFTRSTFGCNEGFCTDRDVSMTSQGVVVGARWAPGLPWVRAGLAVQGLTVQGEGGDDTADPGLGVEVAAGLDLPVWGQFRVRPGIRYLRHDASTDLGDGHVAMLALMVGVSMDIATF